MNFVFSVLIPAILFGNAVGLVIEILDQIDKADAKVAPRTRFADVRTADDPDARRYGLVLAWERSTVPYVSDALEEGLVTA